MTACGPAARAGHGVAWAPALVATRTPPHAGSRPACGITEAAEGPGQPGCAAPRAGDRSWQLHFGCRICPLPSGAWNTAAMGTSSCLLWCVGPGRRKAHTEVSPPFSCAREGARSAFGEGGWRNERNTTVAGLQICKRMQEKTLLNLVSPPTPERTFNTKPQLKLIRSQFGCQRFMGLPSAVPPEREPAQGKLSQNLLHHPLRCKGRGEKGRAGAEARAVPPSTGTVSPAQVWQEVLY